MNIGILTFHNAHNYGAVLQCYALQVIVQQLGHNVDIIDYRNSSIEETYKPIQWKKLFRSSPIHFLKSIILLLPFGYRRFIRGRKFINFVRNQLHLTTKKYTQSIPEIYGYDSIIIGSDQLWNSKWTNGLDKYYWGIFKHDANCKIISYAVSLGNPDFNENEKLQIKCYLKNFDFISVRENSLKESVLQLTGNPVSITLDPTLLTRQDTWCKFLRNNKYGDYVLIYPLKDKKNTINCGIALAKKLHINYIILDGSAYWRKRQHHLDLEGPESFISLLSNSKYVVTSSFHGTAFSIIFQKSFYSFISIDHPNTRIQSLLEQLDLTSRIVQDSNFQLETIDYENVTLRLGTIAEKSIDFIKKSIDNNE